MCLLTSQTEDSVFYYICNYNDYYNVFWYAKMLYKSSTNQNKMTSSSTVLIGYYQTLATSRSPERLFLLLRRHQKWLPSNPQLILCVHWKSPLPGPKWVWKGAIPTGIQKGTEERYTDQPPSESLASSYEVPEHQRNEIPPKEQPNVCIYLCSLSRPLAASSFNAKVKVLVLIFKTLNSLGPGYLQDSLNLSECCIQLGWGWGKSAIS